MSALNIQIGGEHYKTAKIQPVQYIEANGLAFLEGCVVKRVTRHNKPTGKGRQDIEKAIHELQLLLELRYPLEPDRADLGDFGQQNMLTPTVKESLTVGSSHSIPKWATHELTNRTRKSTGVYARFQDGQYLSERGRIYNMRRWAVVSQKFTPEQHALTPADWPDENGPKQQLVGQGGELGKPVYDVLYGTKA